MSGAPAVEVREVTRVFDVRGIRREALRGVSLTIAPRTTLAVVGESGSGKSTLARIVAGLDRPTSGTVAIDGAPPRIAGGVPAAAQMVFQSPAESLNPYQSVSASVAEPLRGYGRGARRARVVELLEAVGLDPATAGRRPGAFSGGQQQRIGIARALAAKPQVLICDEPTSALDVSVQAQVVNLLLELQAEVGFAMLLVTHDLGVVRVLADEVALLRDGEIIEHSSATRFFTEPEHEYAGALLEAAR